MKKNVRNVLGRGLSSLISSQPVTLTANAYTSNLAEEISPTSMSTPKVGNPALEETGENSSAQRVRFVDIETVAGNPTQPRQEFNQQEISELADSIKSLGVLQPVLVRPAKGERVGQFEIVAGERRWRAGKLAGLKQLPVIIQEFDDKQSLEIALVENIQRAALNPIEEAAAYERLITEFSMSQKDVAERVGKDRASVANYIRLLRLPSEVVGFIRSGKLSMGHAKAILSIKEPAAQLNLARKVIAENISVRALESIVSRVVVLDQTKRRRRSRTDGDDLRGGAAFPEIIDKLRRTLGTKVNILHTSSGRGKVEIEYFSDQELDRIVDLICHSK